MFAARGVSTWNASPRMVSVTGLVTTPLPTSTLSSSATGTSVSSQYFQDSDVPVGAPGTANYVPAKVPAYTLFDFAADWQLTRNIRALAGVSNLTNRNYYNRVFQNGIEPGTRRTVYAGVALGI